MIMLNERVKAIIRILREADDYVTSKELADKLDISVRTIKRRIKGMKEIQFIGRGSNGHREISDEEK